jgi:hypothetical protein
MPSCLIPITKTAAFQSVLLFKKLDVLKLKCYNNIKAPIIINNPV